MQNAKEHNPSIVAVEYDAVKHANIFDRLEDATNYEKKIIRLQCELGQSTLYECDNGTFIIVSVLTDLLKKPVCVINYIVGSNPIPYVEIIKEKCKERNINTIEYESPHVGAEFYAKKLGFRKKRVVYEFTF